MANLSTDELPRHVEDGPVVDHEVPEASTLDPGPHWGVAQRLLEENLKHENISNMKIFQTWKYFKHENISKQENISKKNTFQNVKIFEHENISNRTVRYFNK